MIHMNDYDIEVAGTTFTRATAPNLLALTFMVEHLAEWTNDHSDGWAYWSKPRQAAQTAMLYINEGMRRHRSCLYGRSIDCTEDDMLSAARTVRAFCTRQVRLGTMHERDREIILRSVTL